MTFTDALQEAAEAARKNREIGIVDLVRVRGICRRAEWGFPRAQQLVKDALELVILEAIATGELPQRPGEDFDFSELIELITRLIETIIALWQFFGGL